MVDLREYAERVLLGASLHDKLHDPGALTDADPGAAWKGAAEPARDPGLAMSLTADPFPQDSAMRDEGTRGRALHFFANHELLALELMALALLRFPNAPAAFRRGLAATMRDEQRHMTLYIDRMEELGVCFGDLGLGGFFWRTVADLDTPAAFMAHMSLTFEQANLDHSRYYATRFADVGDDATAAVMEEVYADEVRHVALGVRWFRQWAPEQPLVDAHREALVAPVSMRRARGRHFDLAGRRAAGLPEAYIQAMANTPITRGKPPVVHLFDPTTELQLAHRGGYNPDAAVRARTVDLETLPLLYARPDDAVLVRRKPSQAFVTGLRTAGFPLADVVVGSLDGPHIDAPELTRIDRVQPWGWTPQLASRLARLRKRGGRDPVPPDGWPTDVFTKVRAVQVLAAVLAVEDPRLDEPGSVGVVATSEPEVRAAVEQVGGSGAQRLVLKAPLGTAGRGMIRLPDGDVTPLQARWISRALAGQGAVIVEPWRDRVCDLSLRLLVTRPGCAEVEGVGRFLVDPRGQYLGAVIGRATTGLPNDVVRFLHGDGQDADWLPTVWRRVTQAVADALAPTGYVGHVGVDAIVWRDPAGALRLRPVLELNTRVHMGHVAVHLAKRVAPGAVGVWRLRRVLDIERAGYASVAAYVDALGVQHPLSYVDEPRRVCSGVLATNDPSQARSVLGLLAVAPSVAAANAMLGVGAD